MRRRKHGDRIHNLGDNSYSVYHAVRGWIPEDEFAELEAEHGAPEWPEEKEFEPREGE